MSCAALLTALNGLPAAAQEVLRPSMAGNLAVAARQAQIENLPYTFKFGDFRLLATPSLRFDYNDNIRLADEDTEDDFILRPFLDLTATYPITQRNLLKLKVGLGYDYYTQHDELSIFRVESDSEISFDMYIKDLWINLHDRISYVQDPGREAGVANTARYGGLNNTAGLTTTLDLNDLILTLGYDHQNFIASDNEFEYLDRASELLLGRAGFRVHPALTVGVEGTGGFTSYDQRILNDNVSYSGGAYGDWQPGNFFRVQPRVGYIAYDFDQTSRTLRAVDQDGWYASLGVAHDITDSIRYTLAVGHEIRLGIQADSIEDTFVRSTVHWRVIRDVSLVTDLSYENGTQGAGGIANLEEDYDWFGGGVSLSRRIMKNLVASLHYRFTLRSANLASRDYTQNVVGLRLTYEMR